MNRQGAGVALKANEPERVGGRDLHTPPEFQRGYLMDRKTKGRLGEAKVLTHFVAEGFEVYVPFTDNSVHDLIVSKDGVVQTVSVKYTSTPSRKGTGWRVHLRQQSPLYGGGMAVRRFDPTAVDLLAVYISPLDQVVVVPSSSIRGETETVVHGT